MPKESEKTLDQGYLSIQGVAETLGISERLAHQLIHDPEDPIPCSRIGKRLIRVWSSDLHEWTARRRVRENKVDEIVNQVFRNSRSK